MTCKQQYPTQKLLCYKEKWTVDGTTSKYLWKTFSHENLTLNHYLVVKRGCAVEDSRYNLTGILSFPLCVQY